MSKRLSWHSKGVRVREWAIRRYYGPRGEKVHEHRIERIYRKGLDEALCRAL